MYSKSTMPKETRNEQDHNMMIIRCYTREHTNKMPKDGRFLFKRLFRQNIKEQQQF